MFNDKKNSNKKNDRNADDDTVSSNQAVLESITAISEQLKLIQEDKKNQEKESSKKNAKNNVIPWIILIIGIVGIGFYSFRSGLVTEPQIRDIKNKVEAEGSRAMSLLKLNPNDIEVLAKAINKQRNINAEYEKLFVDIADKTNENKRELQIVFEKLNRQEEMYKQKIVDNNNFLIKQLSGQIEALEKQNSELLGTEIDSISVNKKQVTEKIIVQDVVNISNQKPTKSTSTQGNGYINVTEEAVLGNMKNTQGSEMQELLTESRQFTSYE